jgi:LPXTG-motif cell wall-anchored protein
VGSGWFCAADVDVYIDNGGLSLVTSIPMADLVDGGFTITAAAPNSAGDYDVFAEYGLNQTSTDCEGQATDPFTVVTPTTTVAPTTTNAVTTTTAAATTTTAAATTTTAAATTTTAAATTTTSLGGGGQTTTTSVGNNAPTTTVGPVSTLPVTGNSSNALAPYALLVLAAGALLVVATRRKSAL